MVKKILVTGGAGFIGANLCAYLLKKGHQIICVDNFMSGRKANIAKYLNNENFKLIEQDIIFPLDVAVDEIYNLACPASPCFYQKDPINTLKISLFGAINMLELARKNKIKIVQASTSEVYGQPEKHPQTEVYCGNVDTKNVRACYSEGKRCAETIFFDYNRKYNIDISVVRIFNTYGPMMRIDDGRAIPNFINQALTDQDITVYGKGEQTRSFQYIDDLIEAMVKIMEKKNFYGPVNIGNPQEISVNDLAQKILALIPDSKSKIVTK
ncbi:MAG: NAD-dependent epimerase/dehydratase family protein, partial [Candidatus Gastranaerophilaceae bacterium]